MEEKQTQTNTLDTTKMYMKITEIEVTRFNGKQSDAANHMGISEQTYSIRKKRLLTENVTLKTIRAFEKAFDVVLITNA